SRRRRHRRSGTRRAEPRIRNRHSRPNETGDRLGEPRAARRRSRAREAIPCPTGAGSGHAPKVLRHLRSTSERTGTALLLRHDPLAKNYYIAFRITPYDALSRNVSRHQLVATGLRHQDLGIGGVFLDLLAQPVDMGFQGVGGDPGIVAPDL